MGKRGLTGEIMPTTSPATPWHTASGQMRLSILSARSRTVLEKLSNDICTSGSTVQLGVDPTGKRWRQQCY